ncbi:putative mannan endo-1,6-alpha-mannosidase [Lachnellula suecica]|uniref:Putative mannan endo-1,6-alpha-mannosidase n=1 Tax=Lachnellula suecica TaxID=602035 RepID=A0A8T9BWN4_9HELO|nr:putative mannan endo-1,6-alpha-mannosidase [Lachnellula suecica]
MRRYGGSSSCFSWGNGTEATPVLLTVTMMVSIRFLQLLSLLVSASPLALSAPSSQTKAEVAFNTLQTWYNRTSGIYDTTGWWNSANCITAIGDLAAIDSSVASTVKDVYSNSIVQAQKYNLNELKVVQTDYNVVSYYGPTFPSNVVAPAATNPKGFLNGYYDDEGWWALAWIQAYDISKNTLYLQHAMDIFADMKSTGATTPCNGGIWWDKAHTYVNAIANELYLSVAAHLANRATGSNKTTYLNAANAQWTWFQRIGLINSKNLINDGLTSSCVNNNATVWTYNQGVILGALVELSTATGNKTLLTKATAIANAAITALSDSNKVLHDPCEPNCGGDGSQFKGVFMRNLQILQKAAPSQTYLDFFKANAASIWAYDQRAGKLSTVWSGGFVSPANASTQSSALDALVADQAFGGGANAIASR